MGDEWTRRKRTRARCVGCQLVCRVWNAPEYTDLKLTGYLANRIQPWGLFAVPVNLAVLNPDHTPYCVSSTNDELNQVLTNEWPHDILASLPS